MGTGQQSASGCDATGASEVEVETESRVERQVLQTEGKCLDLQAGLDAELSKLQDELGLFFIE